MPKSFHHYLITDPHYYGNTPSDLKEQLKRVFQSKRVNMACFRDKSTSNYEVMAKAFIQTCQENNIEKILLNEQYELAIKLQAHGVHLTSQQFDVISLCKQHHLYVIISCHTQEEIAKAQALKADAVTYSPIFETPNKGEPKGVKSLESMLLKYSVPIIALGGITTHEHVEAIEKTNAYGFASIRYFLNP